jgi:hypothetical protein
MHQKKSKVQANAEHATIGYLARLQHTKQRVSLTPFMLQPFSAHLENARKTNPTITMTTTIVHTHNVVIVLLDLLQFPLSKGL